jgi:glycosyltransferase involved in cell wall biosynthesis
VTDSPRKRPVVLVIGMRPSYVGGLATFVRFLFTAPRLQKNYRFMLIDYTRGPRGAGRAGTLSLINVLYFVRQVVQLGWIFLRYRPRILHVPVIAFFPFWKDATLILIGRALGMKVVAHLHSGAFARFWAGSAPRTQRLIRWALNRSDVVIALSKGWQRFLLEEVGISATVEIVPNTIDALFVAANRDVTYGPEREPGSILFVGTVAPKKGVLDILKAAPSVVERHPQARFLFAGMEERPDDRARIEQACLDGNVTDAVHFLGPVAGQAKLDLYLKASIFLLPSYGEGLPYALLEAMSAGLPVVATPVGAIPELVEDGQNGFLVQPGDHQALSDRILRLLDDPALRSAMSRANVERIRQGYLPDEAILRIESIYDRLLAPARAQARAKTLPDDDRERT